MSYEMFKDLIEITLGSTDQPHIVKGYTDHYSGLIEMMTKLYPLLEHRSIKTDLEDCSLVSR